MRGYVAVDAGLAEAYERADAFLHVSWTEGMPQVLLEAFASRLPTVATAVGGVGVLAGDAALLVEPETPEPPLTRWAGSPPTKVFAPDWSKLEPWWRTRTLGRSKPAGSPPS